MSSDKILLKHVGGSTLQGSEQQFDKMLISLGRNPDNDVVFDRDQDRMVSGRHAEIFIENGKLHIRDLGSTNGTFINDVRITSARRLSRGDIVRLGDSGAELQARLLDAGMSSMPSMPSSISETPKKYVGEHTLRRVVMDAVLQERSSNRVKIAALAGGILLVGVLGVIFFWKGQRDLSQKSDQFAALEDEVQKTRNTVDELAQASEKNLRDSLTHYDEEIRSLKGQVGDREKEFGRKMLEVQSRIQSLDELRKNQSLSKEQREALEKEIEGKLVRLKEEFKKSEDALRKASRAESKWPELVDGYEESMFLVVGEDPGRKVLGTGTAFIIRENGLLATNAHVVRMLLQMPTQIVIQNKTGKPFKVKRAVAHPSYNGVTSPDVGLIEFDAKDQRFRPFVLATNDELKELRIGAHLGTLGYPGELQSQYFSSYDRAKQQFKTVQATFKQGWVGRITNYKLEQDLFALSRFIQHSASLTKGTSGSPMFTVDGKVMAVMASVYQFEYAAPAAGKESSDPKDAKLEPVQQQASAAEIGWAIRIDELRDFWRETGW